MSVSQEYVAKVLQECCKDVTSMLERGTRVHVLLLDALDLQLTHSVSMVPAWCPHSDV
jgi:hypothetical protein